MSARHATRKFTRFRERASYQAGFDRKVFYRRHLEPLIASDKSKLASRSALLRDDVRGGRILSEPMPHVTFSAARLGQDVARRFGNGWNLPENAVLQCRSLEDKLDKLSSKFTASHIFITLGRWAINPRQKRPISNILRNKQTITSSIYQPYHTIIYRSILNPSGTRETHRELSTILLP